MKKIILHKVKSKVVPIKRQKPVKMRLTKAGLNGYKAPRILLDSRVLDAINQYQQATIFGY